MGLNYAKDPFWYKTLQVGWKPNVIREQIRIMFVHWQQQRSWGQSLFFPARKEYSLVHQILWHMIQIGNLIVPKQLELRRHLNTLEDQAIVPPAPSSLPTSTEKGKWHSSHHRSCIDGHRLNHPNIILYGSIKECTYRVLYKKLIHSWSEIIRFMSRYVSFSKFYSAYLRDDATSIFWSKRWGYNIILRHLYLICFCPDCAPQTKNQRRLASVSQSVVYSPPQRCADVTGTIEESWKGR